MCAGSDPRAVKKGAKALSRHDAAAQAGKKRTSSRSSTPAVQPADLTVTVRRQPARTSRFIGSYEDAAQQQRSSSVLVGAGRQVGRPRQTRTRTSSRPGRRPNPSTGGQLFRQAADSSGLRPPLRRDDVTNRAVRDGTEGGLADMDFFECLLPVSGALAAIGLFFNYSPMVTPPKLHSLDTLGPVVCIATDPMFLFVPVSAAERVASAIAETRRVDLRLAGSSRMLFASQFRMYTGQLAAALQAASVAYVVVAQFGAQARLCEDVLTQLRRVYEHAHAERPLGTASSDETAAFRQLLGTAYIDVAKNLPCTVPTSCAIVGIEDGGGSPLDSVQFTVRGGFVSSLPYY